MFNIEQYLKKFSLRINDVSGKKIAVIKILQETSGVTILKEDLEIKESVLYVKAKPIIKNQLFLKREKILPLLKEQGIVGIK